jgi:hypothetical protein
MRQEDSHMIMVESLKQGLITSSHLVSLVEVKPFEDDLIRHALSEISTNILQKRQQHN